MLRLPRSLPHFTRAAAMTLRCVGAAIVAGGLLAAPLAAQAGSPATDALRRTIDSLTGLQPPSRDHAIARDRALARAWRGLADSLEAGRDPIAARAAWGEALRVATTAGDSLTRSVAHNAIGLLHWSATAYDSALVHLEAARALRIALGDRPGLGRTLNSLGATYYQLGMYEPALDAFVQAREIWRVERDDIGHVRVLANIGKTYHDWQQYDRALPMLEEAVALARRHGDPATLGYALNTLAVLQLQMGQLDLAKQSIEASRAAYFSGPPRVSTSDSLGGWSLNALALGRLELAAGRPGVARALLDSVLTAAERRGSVRGQARALLHLGEAHAALGAREDARAAFQRALVLARGVEQRVIALDAVERLADLEERAGNTTAALGHLRAFQALRDTIFSQATAQRIAAMESRAIAAREERENAQLREERRVQALVIDRQRLAGTLGAIILALAAVVVGLLVHFMRQGRAREQALTQANADLAEANTELRSALAEVRTLKGLIPICSSCKQVRDDAGYWQSVEAYIASRSEATFSHGICQTCGPKLYGAHWDEAVAAQAAE